MEERKEKTLRVLAVGPESFTLPFVGFGFEPYNPGESPPQEIISHLKKLEKNYDLILVAESIAISIFEHIKSREYNPDITYLIVPDGSQSGVAENLMTERIVKALGARI